METIFKLSFIYVIKEADFDQLMGVRSLLRRRVQQQSNVVHQLERPIEIYFEKVIRNFHRRKLTSFGT